MARGRTESRYGSRHTNVYTARKESVCDHRFQDNNRITLAWKTNTTPIRELKRRKLADIVARLNAGRSMWSGEVGCCLLEGRSSTGITCCRSLEKSTCIRPWF